MPWAAAARPPAASRDVATISIGTDVTPGDGDVCRT